MKNVSKVLLSSLVIGQFLYASSWEDVFKGLDENQEIVDDGTFQVGNNLYESKFDYRIINKDGINGNFDGADEAQIIIKDSSGNELLNSGLLSSTNLENWAQENADEILTSIFGGDPAGSLTGQNSAMASSVETTSVINKLEVDGAIVQSKTLLGSETLSIVNSDTDVTGSGGLFGFSKTLDSQDSVGIIINYKMTEAEDSFNSKTNVLSFSPYYKFNNSINPKLEVPVIVSLVANLVYLESSIFPDGAGYLEYGLGVNVTPTYKLQENWDGVLTLGLQHLEKNIPSSYVPEDAKWLADAINNLKALNVLSLGVGTKYKIQSNWRAEGNILQIKHLVTDNIKDGREKATYYSLSTEYDWEDWTFGLGYKVVEDLKDYEEDAYMLSVKYNW